MNTYRLTCAIRTPVGGVHLDVVHVESAIELRRVEDGERIAAEFFGAERGFYSEIRVEAVPHYARPLAETQAALTP